jgi:hypothetical protein
MHDTQVVHELHIQTQQYVVDTRVNDLFQLIIHDDTKVELLDDHILVVQESGHIVVLHDQIQVDTILLRELHLHDDMGVVIILDLIQVVIQDEVMQVKLHIVNHDMVVIQTLHEHHIQVMEATEVTVAQCVNI